MKKFIDKVIPPKIFRKLSCEEKLTFYYLWMECDPSGIYDLDEDQFQFDNGFEFSEKIVEKLSDYLDQKGSKILVKNFISVHYGNKLREDYNPHKPLFRSISKNNLKLISSLNQASFKLVKRSDVDIEVEEEVKRSDVDEDSTIIYHWKEITGREITKPEKYSRAIRARLKDGYEIEDFKKVFELKTIEWKYDSKMSKHLNLTTILRKDNFTKYVDEVANARPEMYLKTNKQAISDARAKAIDDQLA